MSLTAQLEQKLAAAGRGPASIVVAEGTDVVRCELVSIEGLGVSVDRLELASTHLQNVSTERLKEVADALARQVSYLLEALASIEIDQEGCSVQMRSVPPYRRENSTSYYEVVVAAGVISLRRYTKGPREARQGQPFSITREVLGRLVEDFAAAAGGA